MTVWFTSDTHFGHGNIIGLCGRPFPDAGTMDEALIVNYNSVVRPDDTVYFLGDFAFRADFAVRIPEIISRLNGHKHLVRGNHDGKLDESPFESAGDLLHVSHSACGRSFRLVLCHYPLVEWNGSRRGALHLHGHQHNGPSYNEEQRDAGILRYDVGVDANGFYPVSLEQIASFFGLAS